MSYLNYDLIAENDESTVVARYEKDDTVEERYQSEADLENDFIEQLQRQGYERLLIHTEKDLITNLRSQIERLNHIQFSDKEWDRFFKNEIAAEGKSIADKARTIQKDWVKTLVRDDSTQVNICLLDKEDIHANSTQVINQYEAEDGKRPNRYDVTILVNGLPLVHVELKRRGVSVKQAFNQIERYSRESFWAGTGLYEYAQIFVISNGTQTKYYSNTTREGHIREMSKSKNPNRPRTSNSYEFTSYWADAENKVLNDLKDFTATFFTRHTLLNVLTKYCILTEQNLLLAMRPYQIAATERLLNKVVRAHNAKKYGTRDAGGYIWHTTGSGKTLTSFKAAQMATELPFIDKVLFVVDRKDLDYQTMKEYDRFQKGAANGNASTKILEKQLSDNSRIIITTIQKLATFIKKYPRHDVFGKEIVIIFDECHRSQFGDMHQAIAKKFKRYYIFGFTGTPIFTANISAGAGALKTTQDVFGDKLHTYTIVDAIRDHNVLPFRIGYVSTMKEKEDMTNEQVWSIEKERALMADKRIKNIAGYILDNFDRQTMRGSAYEFSRLVNVEEIVRQGHSRNATEVRRKERLNGFNSIFAVQSIDAAKLYYKELNRQMQAEDFPANHRLKTAVIYSYAPNEDLADENSDDTGGLDQSSRDFLDEAIKDYNSMFGTSYDTSAEKFPNYYKDVSQRMKNREIDLLIVVNMFLTGFDATTLNTLWVDKNLKYHGLLQSFSRTNRILNSVKTFGNIVCFRNLEQATNDALALFGDKDARGTTILRPFDDYLYGYDENGKHVDGFLDFVELLLDKFPQGELPQGEEAEREFIKAFGAVLRFMNLLSCFDEFPGRNPLSERAMQDYMSIYIDLKEKYDNRAKHDAADIVDDLEFEMELVKQVEVTIDYILYLVEKYHEGNCVDAELRVKITKAIDSSPDLRDKKALIEDFIDQLTPDGHVDDEWRDYVESKKREEFASLVTEERLQPAAAERFMQLAFDRGYVPEGGLELSSVLPRISPLDRRANRKGVMLRVLDRLKAFFAKFYDITHGQF